MTTSIVISLPLSLSFSLTSCMTTRIDASRVDGHGMFSHPRIFWKFSNRSSQRQRDWHYTGDKETGITQETSREGSRWTDRGERERTKKQLTVQLIQLSDGPNEEDVWWWIGTVWIKSFFLVHKQWILDGRRTVNLIPGWKKNTVNLIPGWNEGMGNKKRHECEWGKTRRLIEKEVEERLEEREGCLQTMIPTRKVRENEKKSEREREEWERKPEEWERKRVDELVNECLNQVSSSSLKSHFEPQLILLHLIPFLEEKMSGERERDSEGEREGGRGR